MERQRLIREVIEGKLDVKAAAEILNKSVRQVYRLVDRAKQFGLASISHGNKGRSPANKIDQTVWEEILILVREHYSLLSIYKLKEVLRSRHGIIVGRESLRKKLLEAGIKPTASFKVKKASQKG